MTHQIRRHLAVGVALATALALAGCGSDKAGGSGDAAGTEEAEYVFAYEGPTGTAQEIAANIFGEGLDEASDGAMTIKQYPAAQLGGEPDLLEKIRAGDIDFIISSTANAAAIMEESGVFSMHYLVPDRETAAKVFQDEAVNEAYQELAAEKVKGAKPLTLFMLPLRNMYADFEVHSVADIKGKKVRVQATATEDKLFGAYGAQSVHMAFPELYSALQTGVVDAAENAVTYYGLNKHYEVAPIMSITEHEMNGQVIWTSQKTWDDMSEEQRDAVLAAAEKVRSEQPGQALELQDELQAKYAEMGVKFIEDVDKESFQEISVPLQDEIAADISPAATDLLEKIRAVTGE